MAARRYFFRATTGSTIGPVNLDALAEMIRTGDVQPNTPISLDGEHFRPMMSLPELATLLSVDAELPTATAQEDVPDASPTYSGELTEVSIPKLMYHFVASRTKGRLLVFHQAIQKDLYLVNGKPVAVRSNLERDHLSRHLVDGRLLDSRRARELWNRFDGDEKQLADHLVQDGLLEPHQLHELLKKQLLETIYELFRWRLGRYAFYEADDYTGSPLTLDLDPWQLIVQGVRTGYDISELRELLYPLRDRVLVARDNPAVHPNQLMLLPSESKVFRSVSAGWTLGTILDRLGGDEQKDRTILCMVYMGIELELIGVGEPISVERVDAKAVAQAGEQWDTRMGRAEDSEQDAPVSRAARPTERLSDEQRALLEVYNDLKEKNHFDRLGLKLSANSAQASKAFIKAARDYHPDQTPTTASERTLKLRSRIFSLFNEAHQTLSDDAKRNEYLQALQAGFDHGQVDVTKIMKAEMLFHKAEVLVNNQRFADALKIIEEAIELNPEDGEFYVYRGYAAYFAKPNRDSAHLGRCLHDIARGLKMRDEKVPTGFLFLGLIYKAVGDNERAEKNFRKVLALDRNNLQAARELRLLNLRSGKKKGFWSR